MDNTPVVNTPLPMNNKNGGKKNSLPVVVAIIILVAIVAGIIFFRQQKSNQTASNITPTSTNEEPTATPTPAIEKATVKIQVLNGTGTPGQAASAVDALKNAGYSSDNIKTDNAENYDHTSTTIAAKKGFEGAASDIKSALSSTFDKITIDSLTLPSGSEYDVVVTTGGKIYATPTAEATATPSASPTTTVTPTATPTITPTPTP